VARESLRAFIESEFFRSCEAFVRSSNVGDGTSPSVATMRLRRSALRLMFRAARDLGLVDGDPTLDLVLPSRTDETARPLTDLEVQRCERAALEDLASTRLVVPWALGEATARTAEIPNLRMADLDLDVGQVWIHGSSKTEPRWGLLTKWGVAQIERHLREHPEGVSKLGRGLEPRVRHRPARSRTWSGRKRMSSSRNLCGWQG
jgi:integrase